MAFQFQPDSHSKHRLVRYFTVCEIIRYAELTHSLFHTNKQKTVLYFFKMSSTTTAVRPSPTACSNLYDTPIRDAVCAMPYSNKHIDYLRTCCKDAEVVSYYDDCGLYCLAQGQSVSDLIECLYDEGAKWEDVFCRGPESATATATGAGNILPSADASVVEESDSDDRDGDDNNDNDNNDNDNDDEDNKDGDDEDAKGAASSLHKHSKSSIFGLIVGLLLVGAVLP